MRFFMNKCLVWAAVVFLLLGATFNAEASFYQVDIDTSGMDKLSSHLFYNDDTYTWTFDIDDPMFDSSLQTFESASLELGLSDDSGWELLPEKVEIYFNQSNDRGRADWAAWSWDISGTYLIDITSLDSLNQDGTLRVTLKADVGDFYIDSIRLNAWATDLPASSGGVNPVPTPESSTLLLLGLGLLAVGNVIRRKQI